MNWTNLFKMQAELDEYIGKSKGINMADHKLERIIALQVEFGELTNELRFIFKYWSNKKWNRERALEEYVDGIHFLLSIGNDLGIKEYEYKQPNEQDMRVLVLGINNMISRLFKKRHGDYEILLDHYLLLGEKLGFTEDEILTSYELKHAENYSRQANGY